MVEEAGVEGEGPEGEEPEGVEVGGIGDEEEEEEDPLPDCRGSRSDCTTQNEGKSAK